MEAWVRTDSSELERHGGRILVLDGNWVNGLNRLPMSRRLCRASLLLNLPDSQETFLARLGQAYHNPTRERGINPVGKREEFAPRQAAFCVKRRKLVFEKLVGKVPVP